MAPLFVIITAFVTSIVVNKIFNKEYRLAQSARAALSVMLVFTAAGHFMYAEGMAKMIPAIVPFKKEMIMATGIIEIAAAVGLHVKKYRTLTAWLLILFFIAILPANIKAAFDHLDYKTGMYNGNGPAYLWFRVPLQLLFIVWTYLSSIKISVKNPANS
jgi:uncharacterized membrane protein